jgi:hypothetical protein
MCLLSNSYSCSFLRFLFRAIIHLAWLTPKPSSFAEAPEPQPYVAAILGSNVICMLFHALGSRPSAGEASRGYLHGGAIMDFIGVKGPTSKFHLLLMDALILMLQLVMLSLNIKNRALKKRLGAHDRSIAGPRASTGNAEQEPTSIEDLDAEERGVRRRSSSVSSSSALDPETQIFYSIDDHSGNSPAHHDFLDTLSTGQAVITDLYIIDTIQEQFRAYNNRPRASSSSSSTARSASAIAAEIAGRRNGFRTGFRLTAG